jgi:hypothetical protein
MSARPHDRLVVAISSRALCGFDDQTGHIERALAHVPAGHVAAGVAKGGATEAR